MLGRADRKAKFQGPLTGLLTAFAKDETINTDALKEEARFALERCKATGIMTAAAEIQEVARLSRTEKFTCMEAVVDVVSGKVPVIVGATDSSTFGSIELAKHAQDVGAGAIMVAPPVGVVSRGTMSPLTEQDVLNFYDDLSRAVDIPILVYNSPTFGSHQSVRSLLKIFEHDNIVGMEENSMDYHVIMRDCLALKDNVSILVRSHVFLPSLEAGAHGAIMPVGISRIGADLYEAYQKGDRKKALELQSILGEIPPEQLSHKPGISFYKEAVTQLGLNVGLPRRPSVTLDDKEKDMIRGLLKHYGLDVLEKK